MGVASQLFYMHVIPDENLKIFSVCHLFFAGMPEPASAIG